MKEAIDLVCDENLRFRLNRLDSQVKMTFDLISQRMGWLIISHSFLFSAYTNSAIAQNPSLPAVRVALLWVLPVVAILSAFLVGCSVEAAFKILSSYKKKRDRLEAEAQHFGYESITISTHTWSFFLGSLPGRVLPWILLSSWLVLLTVSVVFH
jgi:hypothetical protein